MSSGLGVRVTVALPDSVTVCAVGATTGVSATRDARKYRSTVRARLGSAATTARANAYSTNRLGVTSGASASGAYVNRRSSACASANENPAALVSDSMPTVAPLYDVSVLVRASTAMEAVLPSRARSDGA